MHILGGDCVRPSRQLPRLSAIPWPSPFVDPSCISPLLACRLIALEPGVRPIGIGETSRRIIAKAVLTVTRSDIQDAAGSVQLCAGQIAGAESAVQAVRESFKQDGTDAVLLVDASNAFNRMLLSITSDSTAQPYQPFSSTLTGHLPSCTSMGKSSTLRRGLLRVTPWRC